jgi:hypothetical protein
LGIGPFFFLLNLDVFCLFFLKKKNQQFFAQYAGICYDCSPCSALYGEATAALLAARLTVSLGLSSFILEGDSLNVTMALQQPTITINWGIASTISIIHSTIPLTASWKASHVDRSANFCIYHVVNWAATKIHSGCITILFSSIHIFSSMFWKRLSLHPLYSISLFLSFGFFTLYSQKKKKKKKKQKDQNHQSPYSKDAESKEVKSKSLKSKEKEKEKEVKNGK